MNDAGVMDWRDGSIAPARASGVSSFPPGERDEAGEQGATYLAESRRRLPALPMDPRRTDPSSCHDPAHRAFRFLRFLMSGYPPEEPLSCEIRAIRPGEGADDERVLRRWFGLDDEYLRHAAEWCAAIAGEYDVYVGVLPRRGRGGFARDVSHARMLWADVDAGDAPGGVFDLLKASGLLPHMGAMVVTASGGAHVYWPLAATESLCNPESRLRYRELLKRVVRTIGGQKPGPHADGNAAEEARVLRVPGTLYHKRRPASPVRAAYLTDAELHDARWWDAALPLLPVSDRPLDPVMRARKGLPHSGRVFRNDDELVAAACRASADFTALMSGDLSGYDGDDSRADMALMTRLAWWTDRDPARMERIFGRSLLARRDKWRRADYRRRTIERALAAT